MTSAKIVKTLPKSYTIKEVSKELRKESFKQLRMEQKNDNFSDPIFSIDKGKRTEDKRIIKKAKAFVEISQRADSLAKSLKFLIPRLLNQSPVKSGEYKRSHYVDFDNGKTYNLNDIKTGSIKDLKRILEDVNEARIYNTSIYANKLERTGNSQSSSRGNLIFIRANGVYDFFSKKIRGASFSGVIARVGRSDRYPVRKDKGYTRKGSKETIVLPVIFLSIAKGAG